MQRLTCRAGENIYMAIYNATSHLQSWTKDLHSYIQCNGSLAELNRRSTRLYTMQWFTCRAGEKIYTAIYNATSHLQSWRKDPHSYIQCNVSLAELEKISTRLYTVQCNVSLAELEKRSTQLYTMQHLTCRAGEKIYTW